MPSLRLNPNRVKLNRSYDARELADLLGVHKNTVSRWRAAGLKPIDPGKPALFHGADVRAFLSARNNQRKRSCPPGTFYCFRCKDARRPALSMVEFTERTPSKGVLSALCDTCGALMHRATSRTQIAAVMPDIEVAFVKAGPRLKGKAAPSSIGDFPAVEGAR